MANRGPILVVDDEPSILDFVRMTLEDEGYDVITADNGAQALDAARQHLPRLILLDLRMPVMSGEDFMTAYRAMPGPHAPIVILTAARDGQKRAAKAAVETHLGKPFDLAELVDLVGKYVT